MFRPIAIVTLFVVFLLSILGCQQRVADSHPTATRRSKPISQSSVSKPTQTSEPSPTSPSVTTLPMESSWILGNNPIAIEGEISIGIHVVVITDQHITLVYSVPDNSGINPDTDDVKLTDDADSTYKILDATNLAKIDGLQIESITFEGPKPGTTRLDLFVQSKVGQLMVNIAQADIPNTPPDLIEGIQNLIPREDYLEQGKYRVSFNGFSPQTGDLVGLQKNPKGMTKEEVLSSNATRVASTPESSEPPTAFPQNNVTSKLSEGKPLVGGATIRIENQSTKQAQYLYIVFLTDGNVKAQWLE